MEIKIYEFTNHRGTQYQITLVKNGKDVGYARHTTDAQEAREIAQQMAEAYGCEVNES